MTEGTKLVTVTRLVSFGGYVKRITCSAASIVTVFRFSLIQPDFSDSSETLA